MINRRDIIKSSILLPFISKTKPTKEKSELETKSDISGFPTIYQYWRGRWYKSIGNKIEWTDYRHRPQNPAINDDFVNWNVIDIIDYCEALVPHRDILLWIGKNEVWEIDYDYCLAFKEFMHKFQYKCRREKLNILILDAGISI